MAKNLTFTITDSQQSSLEQYIALPQFCPLAFSQETQQNEPTRQFPTIESFLQFKFSGMMDGIMRTCPPSDIQAKLDAIASLQAEIAATTLAQNVMLEAQ